MAQPNYIIPENYLIFYQSIEKFRGWDNFDKLFIPDYRQTPENRKIERQHQKYIDRLAKNTQKKMKKDFKKLNKIRKQHKNKNIEI